MSKEKQVQGSLDRSVGFSVFHNGMIVGQGLTVKSRLWKRILESLADIAISEQNSSPLVNVRQCYEIEIVYRDR